MKQTILQVNGEYSVLDPWFRDKKRCMLVCGPSIQNLKIHSYLKNLPQRLHIKIVPFSDFQPNPLYDSVTKGVKLFREEACDSILAVGGGSAMDVAKCIKLYANLPGDGQKGEWLTAETKPGETPFLAMPTTSGSGSEATQFAVIYYEGIKQSIADVSCMPGTVLLDAGVLQTLPLYQKKATMCDALCHAIESFWSKGSTEESMAYSEEAITQILVHKEAYLAGTNAGHWGMLLAANIAGKAINIAQTTAGHAMCYNLTALFGCAHGHAAFLCNRVLYPWMIQNSNKCVDPRGEEHLIHVLDRIGRALGAADAASGAGKLTELFRELALPVPSAKEAEYAILQAGVNPERLKNHPIALDADTIKMLYHKIL